MSVLDLDPRIPALGAAQERELAEVRDTAGAIGS